MTPKQSCLVSLSARKLWCVWGRKYIHSRKASFRESCSAVGCEFNVNKSTIHMKWGLFKQKHTLDKFTYWAVDKQERDLVIFLGSSGSVFNSTFEVILWNLTTAYRRINSICNGRTFAVLYGWRGFCKKTKLPETQFRGWFEQYQF